MDKKTLLLIIVILSAFISACAPSTYVPETKTEPQPTGIHKISSENLSIVRGLFDKNNLNLEDFQILEFEIRQERTDSPKVGYYLVRANRVYKGLVIFFGGDVMYHFNEGGSIAYQTGCVYTTCEVPGDILLTPQVSKEEAIRALCEEYPIFSIINLSTELGIVKKEGVYNLSDFVLAWKMTVGEAKYPFGLVNAIDGKVIYADDGIRY